MRLLFAADLDNTLLHSRRLHRPGDVCVEWIDGREQGYMRPRAIALLRRLCGAAVFAPVTARSVEQYRRIRFPGGCEPDCAAVANGGALLTADGPDPVWAGRAGALVGPWRGELARLSAAAEGWPGAVKRRVVDGVYLFALFEGPEAAAACAEGLRCETPLQPVLTGRKLYLLPPGLHKGWALEGLRRRFPGLFVVAAGDSAADAPMLARADAAVCPPALAGGLTGPGSVYIWPGDGDFSEFALEVGLRCAGVIP